MNSWRASVQDAGRTSPRSRLRYLLTEPLSRDPTGCSHQCDNIVAVIEIPLRNRAGGVRAWSLIDDIDAPLAEVRWSLNGGYATRQATVGGRRTSVSLHRAVAERAGFGDASVVDHISRDRLDNRRGNLRRSTPLLNARNRSLPYEGRYVQTPEERRNSARRQREFRARNKARLRQEAATARAREAARDVLALSKSPFCGCCGESHIDFLVVEGEEILCRNCAHAHGAGMCPHHGISRRLG